MPTLVSPYKYAKLCGVSPQAINQRIACASLEVTELTAPDGSMKRFIDCDKYPPENKAKNISDKKE